MSNPDDPAAWIAKAENDLLNIDNNLASNLVPWDTVCFHSQQAAEKMLKAFLVARGETVARTHDLIVLLARSADHQPTLNKLETDCRLLNPYSVLVRYPGSVPTPSADESRSAVASSRVIYKTVREILLGSSDGGEVDGVPT